MVCMLHLILIGKLTKGLEGKPDTTFSILDEDFVALSEGKANPQNLVMTVRYNVVNLIGKNED